MQALTLGNTIICSAVLDVWKYKSLKVWNHDTIICSSVMKSLKVAKFETMIQSSAFFTIIFFGLIPWYNHFLFSVEKFESLKVEKIEILKVWNHDTIICSEVLKSLKVKKIEILKVWPHDTIICSAMLENLKIWNFVTMIQSSAL